MTLLAPLFFYLALGAAAITVGLHFIVTRQPQSSTLPTARFVPRDTVRVTTISRPRDLLLLLLRVATILLIGLAFAQPLLLPDRRPVARVVLADMSSAVADAGEVRDSVRALTTAGDVLIVFDSAARTVRSAELDTITKRAAPSRLSPALILAMREGARIRSQADSIEIVVVSPLSTSALDAGTFAIRQLWPGRIRIAHVAAHTDSLRSGGAPAIRTDEQDALRFALADWGNSDARVRILRDDASAEDSAWAAAGGTLVRWPRTASPAGWNERPSIDTVGGVVAGDAALVYPLVRRWETAQPGIVAARWIDGEAAAAERVVGAGCIRDVAIAVPQRGDLVLRPAFARLVEALAQPCRALATGVPADSTTLAAIKGDGELADHDSIPAPEDVRTPLVPWLLAGALLLAVLEPFIRGRRSAASSANDSANPLELAA